MTEEKVKAVLIASGGGTDGDAIMRAWVSGCIPEVEIYSLISTKADAGCLEKAEKLGVETKVFSLANFRSREDFDAALGLYLFKHKINLVFLVGCIVKILPYEGIAIYNIHPADPYKHGGDGMYGLDVHEHVLHEIFDQIVRGKKKMTDRFFTYPTIHEVEEEYDSGRHFLRHDVEIPNWIIRDFVEDNPGSEESIKALQTHVLPYEWIMLPAAVRMAAKKIMDERSD